MITCLRFSSHTAPLKPLQDMCTVSPSLVLPIAPSTENTPQGKDGKLLAPGPDFDIEADSIVDTLFLKVLEFLTFKNFHKSPSFLEIYQNQQHGPRAPTACNPLRPRDAPNRVWWASSPPLLKPLWRPPRPGGIHVCGPYNQCWLE